MSLPSGLSVEDLCANLPCAWFRISLAKRGPLVRWACKFCHIMAKTRTCPMERAKSPAAVPAPSERGES